jgi:hypothetical protein
MATDDRRRRFDDREVALILRRASEMQETTPGGGGSPQERGLSLADLEQVAREAGLDPTLIHRAAAELDSRPAAPARSGLLGRPTRFDIERTLDGVVPESEFETMVDEIRRTVGDVGNVSTLARSLAWDSTRGGREARVRRIGVTIVPRNGRTVIRIHESLSALAGELGGGIVGGVGGGVGAGVFGLTMGTTAALFPAIALGGGILAGAWALASRLFISKADDRAEELTALMDRLADHVIATAVRERPQLPEASGPPS